MDTEYDEFHRPDRDTVLLEATWLFARRATCGRLQVGAVIAKAGRILVTGYNGPPSGFAHCNPECLALHKDGCNRSIHAEVNAIAYAARWGISIEGATLYCTHMSCRKCAELIINSGITKFVYQQPYRSNEPRYVGEQLLRDAGIDIIQLSL